MSRVFFVTGADRGLGFSLTKLLLEEGNTVFAGQYMPEWKELEGIKQNYPELYIVPLDVSDFRNVNKAKVTVEKNTDHVDVLINCAGIDGQLKGIREEYDYERMLKVLNINSLGPIRVIQNFIPLLDRGEKKIWTVSSEAGSIGECWRKEEEEYCMSKAALNMAIRIIQNELKDEGYEFRLYHPGWMNTYMTGEKETKADLDPDDAARLLLDRLDNQRTQDDLCIESYNGKIWAW